MSEAATGVRPRPADHKIRLRREQQLIWVGLSIVLGTGFVAGGYWLLLQQHYPFMPGSGSLKLWWDNGMGFIHSGRWPVLRHGVRDEGEPATWTIMGALLLLKSKGYKHILPAWALVTWSVVLGLATVAATIGITWAINFSSFSKVPDSHMWKQLVAGVLLGFLLKRAWSPVTQTIRYHIITQSLGAEPLWVRFPILSPAWREEWWMLNGNITTGTRRDWKLVPLVAFIVLGFLFVAVVGNLAKYAIPHGIHIPGMTSG